MTVMVALLRGVNVGGRGKLAMADLRAIATELGYDDVATYIQSGNLVLTTTNRRSAVAAELEAAISASTRVAPAVVVRTRAELHRVHDRNPYLARGEDPVHLHVAFTTGAAEALVASLDLGSYAPEEATAVGSELYLFLPNGVGRSKLAVDIGRSKGTVGTQRNWRTVTKLLEMADEAAR